MRSIIEGPLKTTFEEAQFATALEACHQLRNIQELDENWMPLGRENMKIPKIVPNLNSKATTSAAVVATASTDSSNSTETKPIESNPTPTPKSVVSGTPVSSEIVENSVKHGNNSSNNVNVPGRPGTTKRRQYYFKRMAKCFSDPKQEHYNLYALKMRLTCAIPEEQNTRGRKIHPPEEAEHCFGILVQSEMPPICEFPIYTRDGEIFVETFLVEADFVLNDQDKEKVLKFHKYTYTQVLRLEKFPMIFKPEDANSSVLVVPLSNTKNQCIDWEFLTGIDYEKCTKLENVSEEDRAKNPILDEHFRDAVVTPWYRNQDQPQYFYVAEICNHLSPNSDFPGQGFDTFEKYYKDKYKINIQHLEQPLLDVDHTSARLNFLTPRYVNRKGKFF